MALDRGKFTVLSTARFFTSWHYDATDEDFTETLFDGFFSEASDLLKNGDVLNVSISDCHGVPLVIAVVRNNADEEFSVDVIYPRGDDL